MMLQEELSFAEYECAELERAKTMPIVFDEDCPETTPERALRFRQVNPIRTAQQAQTHTVTHTAKGAYGINGRGRSREYLPPHQKAPNGHKMA